MRGGGLRRAGRRPDHRFTLESHFCAGDVAAPARSPKPPRRAGRGTEVLQVAVAVQHVDDGQDDIEQLFKELEHGFLRDGKGESGQRLPMPRTRGMSQGYQAAR